MNRCYARQPRGIFPRVQFSAECQSRVYLAPNLDNGVFDEDPFGTSASGLISGKGEITKVVLLGAGGDEPYEKDLLLKSVRISGELESEENAPRNNSFFICDAPTPRYREKTRGAMVVRYMISDKTSAE